MIVVCAVYFRVSLVLTPLLMVSGIIVSWYCSASLPGLGPGDHEHIPVLELDRVVSIVGNQSKEIRKVPA